MQHSVKRFQWLHLEALIAGWLQVHGMTLFSWPLYMHNTFATHVLPKTMGKVLSPYFQGWEKFWAKANNQL